MIIIITQELFFYPIHPTPVGRIEDKLLYSIFRNKGQVELADGEKIEFGPQGGLVVVAIGMQPNVDFVEDSDLEIGQLGIKVNSKMETNLDHVYAVGDCVEYKSAITDEVTGSNNLATNAVPMGRLLAHNLLVKAAENALSKIED